MDRRGSASSRSSALEDLSFYVWPGRLTGARQRAVYLKFACHSIYAACVFSCSFIGSRWGINGVAVGVVVAITVIYLLMAWLTTKLGASWKEYFLCRAPGAILGVVAAAFTILATQLLRYAHLPRLVILAGAVITSTVAGVLAGLSLPRAWLINVSFGRTILNNSLIQLAGVCRLILVRTDLRLSSSPLFTIGIKSRGIGMINTQTALETQVPFYRPELTGNEIEEVTAALKSGWLTSGPRVRRFEREFADAVGARPGSGRQLLHRGAPSRRERPGLEPGMGVLVPTMTFAATAAVVRYQGAVPILVDCDPVTFNMSLDDAARKLSRFRDDKSPGGAPKGAQAVGMIPVHVGGLMMDMDDVNRFASEHGLWVVEDGAHAPAAWRRGPGDPWRRCGGEPPP